MVHIENGAVLAIGGTIEEIGEDITKMIASTGLGIIESDELSEGSVTAFMASILMTAMDYAESKEFNKELKEACRLAMEYESSESYARSSYQWSNVVS